jgi:UDP-glucose 4,6-dehydratase
MKTVLILGKGYIGSQLDTFLRRKNLQVISYRKSELDYTNPFILQKLLLDHKDTFEVIINCSGYTGSPNVDACEANKKDCWYWNVIVPHNIVLAASTHYLPVFNISSGCIYSGYDKEFTENDEPNFGLYNDMSSYYSKTKHACETLLSGLYAYTFRVRMPFEDTLNSKNYLNKLFKYDTLISQPNSLTSVADMCELIFRMLFLYRQMSPGPINVVNEGTIEAREIVDMMKHHGIVNDNWKFIELADLQVKANRSNCILSNSKLKEYNVPLPDVRSSLERDISELSKYLKK